MQIHGMFPEVRLNAHTRTQARNILLHRATIILQRCVRAKLLRGYISSRKFAAPFGVGCLPKVRKATNLMLIQLRIF